MYESLSFLSGIILAVMIQINGNLSNQFGVYHAAFYVHIVGSAFATLLLLVKKQKLNLKGIPLWMYMGGAIGVLTTVFNNIAFSHISLTSIVALGLFGQLILSYFIDRYGLFGMKQVREDLSIPCIALSMLGIVFMIDSPTSNSFTYIAISLCAGISVVLSRTVNAHLSTKIGALQGSLVNHLVGLPICFVLSLAIPEHSINMPFRFWIWCGGILGVLIVVICNVTVPKIPAYHLTLFTLCGQLFCGILLDLLSRKTLNWREFQSGLLVATGIIVNQILKIYHKKQAEKEREYREVIARVEQEYLDSIYNKRKKD